MRWLALRSRAVRPASELERRRLNELFAALCAIASPTGSERACMDRVIAELRGLGLEHEEDDAGPRAGAGAGNVLVRIPGRAARTVLLCAHADTVPVEGGVVEPELVDGAWCNARPAILGADNKAAVAVLLALAHRVGVEGSPVGLELLFTVAEETGLAGTRALDRSWLRAELGYVFDHATPIGEVIVAAPASYHLAADLHGRAAHAGIRPEDGRSAVVAAARAIAAMPLGRIDEQTTANVASIHGGGAGTNVVPGRCRVVGETRSHDEARAEAAMTALVDRLQDAANVPVCACDLDVTVERVFAAYRHEDDAPALRAAEAALRACGHTPRRVASGGGSDANALVEAGLPVVNLANGTQGAHQPDERVSVAALEGMVDVTMALLEECAT